MHGNLFKQGNSLMKFTIPVLLLLILSQSCIAQKASFSEVKLKPDVNYYNTKDSSIIFPIVVTKNAEVDNLINSRIMYEMLQPEDSSQNLRQLLAEHIENGLIDLSYGVTFNTNGLLSFSIRAEGCGAHCSSWTTWFNFDLNTGKEITIRELMKESGIDRFKSMVGKDKKAALIRYLAEQKKALSNKDQDSVTYEWSISQVEENCLNSISIENFSLSEDALEIFDNCEFPYAIRSQEPTIELKYSFRKISDLLNPKFKKLLR